MATSDRHTGSAVGTFLVHALLWPIVIAVLVILAGAASAALDKGAAEALSFLSARTVVATIFGLYFYAAVPAAIIGLVLAVFAYNSGTISRKQASLTAIIVALAVVAAIYAYNRKVIPVDLAKDTFTSGVYVVIGAILSTLLVRALLRLMGVIAR